MNMCIDLQEVSTVLVYGAPVYRHIWHRLLHIHVCRLMHGTTLQSLRLDNRYLNVYQYLDQRLDILPEPPGQLHLCVTEWRHPALVIHNSLTASPHSIGCRIFVGFTSFQIHSKSDSGRKPTSRLRHVLTGRGGGSSKLSAPIPGNWSACQKILSASTSSRSLSRSSSLMSRGGQSFVVASNCRQRDRREREREREIVTAERNSTVLTVYLPPPSLSLFPSSRELCTVTLFMANQPILRCLQVNLAVTRTSSPCNWRQALWDTSTVFESWDFSSYEW